MVNANIKSKGILTLFQRFSPNWLKLGKARDRRELRMNIAQNEYTLDNERNIIISNSELAGKIKKCYFYALKVQLENISFPVFSEPFKGLLLTKSEFKSFSKKS